MGIEKQNITVNTITSQTEPVSEPIFTFAVITDGHINPEEDQSSSPWESNHMANGRNRYVVHMLNRLKPDFVIHLGDLVHPVPSLPSYTVAAGRFHDIYQQLDCPLHLMPGNHDVGDKPSSWTPAEVVNEAFWPSLKSTSAGVTARLIINAAISFCSTASCLIPV